MNSVQCIRIPRADSLVDPLRAVPRQDLVRGKRPKLHVGQFGQLRDPADRTARTAVSTLRAHEAVRVQPVREMEAARGRIPSNRAAANLQASRGGLPGDGQRAVDGQCATVMKCPIRHVPISIFPYHISAATNICRRKSIEPKIISQSSET